jgi:hypothetical protein
MHLGGRKRSPLGVPNVIGGRAFRIKIGEPQTDSGEDVANAATPEAMKQHPSVAQLSDG